MSDVADTSKSGIDAGRYFGIRNWYVTILFIYIKFVKCKFLVSFQNIIFELSNK